jgi:hypothetical protein
MLGSLDLNRRTTVSILLQGASIQHQSLGRLLQRLLLKSLPALVACASAQIDQQRKNADHCSDPEPLI